MNERTAQCSCGALKVTCRGEPVRVSVCHCLSCQRRTGAPFGQQARWASAQVTASGPATEYARVGDSGGTATFRFCPTCGSTVWFDVDKLPGFVIVPVGAFAEPTFNAPQVSVYETRKHPWVLLPAAVEHFD